MKRSHGRFNSLMRCALVNAGAAHVLLGGAAAGKTSARVKGWNGGGESGSGGELNRSGVPGDIRWWVAPDRSSKEAPMVSCITRERACQSTRKRKETKKEAPRRWHKSSAPSSFAIITSSSEISLPAGMERWKEEEKGSKGTRQGLTGEHGCSICPSGRLSAAEEKSSEEQLVCVSHVRTASRQRIIGKSHVTITSASKSAQMIWWQWTRSIWTAINLMSDLYWFGSFSPGKSLDHFLNFFHVCWPNQLRTRLVGGRLPASDPWQLSLLEKVLSHC